MDQCSDLLTAGATAFGNEVDENDEKDEQDADCEDAEVLHHGRVLETLLAQEFVLVCTLGNLELRLAEVHDRVVHFFEIDGLDYVLDDLFNLGWPLSELSRYC